MRYALIKFRVYSLGEKMFSVSYRSRITAYRKSNFVVFYKPGKNNILADALSRRPDYDHDAMLAISQVVPMMKTMTFDCAVPNWWSMQWSRHVCYRSQIAESYDSFYTKSIYYHRHPSEVSLAKMTLLKRDDIKLFGFMVLY
ncbi:unnamed protein product [Peronospora belbahrii]|uniref:Reverse transcriptase RNase H-like domain-containing protein n=1 Tax=Peronospora belbahrii TaxID=622444 RepID=A0AAU9LE01_9STRA|nr:unnamed protein product [Peronospora belbahrii]